MTHSFSYCANCLLAAHATGRVFAQRAAQDIHVQRVDRKQFAAQAAIDSDQQLECFRRLQRADDAYQRREHAGRRAAQFFRLAVFGEQAVVAGCVVAAVVEDGDLAVELDGRARYQRFAQCHSRRG